MFSYQVKCPMFVKSLCNAISRWQQRAYVQPVHKYNTPEYTTPNSADTGMEDVVEVLT